MPKFEMTIGEDVFVRVVIEAPGEDELRQFFTDDMEGQVADLVASKRDSQTVEERYIRSCIELPTTDTHEVDLVIDKKGD